MPQVRRSGGTGSRPGSPTLLTQNKMRTPIQVPAFFVVLGANRAFLAPTGRLHAVRGNAERDQEILRCLRAPLAQAKIVFRGAALVAIAFDRNASLRVGAEEFRVLGQYLASLAAEIRFIRVEVGVFDVLGKHLIDTLLVRGWLFRLRRVDIYVRRRRGAAACTSRSDRVSGRGRDRKSVV